MSRFQAVPYEDRPEINMSPMLDVVFIMLIFFIVLATFLDETAMPVALPQSSSEPVPPEIEPINVVVKADGVFVINGRVTSGAGVQSYVQALYAENPGASYGVLLSKGSKVKDAAVAIEAGRRIGLEVVPIAPTYSED